MQRTGNILVVDDDPTIANLLIEILTDDGYVAYAEQPGAQALAAIARYSPALLVMDIRRPDLDGGALIAQARAAGLTTMPIVVMTTAPYAADPLLIPEAIEFLAKPFDLDNLLACVARYVQPSQASGSTIGAPVRPDRVGTAHSRVRVGLLALRERHCGGAEDAS